MASIRDFVVPCESSVRLHSTVHLSSIDLEAQVVSEIVNKPEEVKICYQC